MVEVPKFHNLVEALVHMLKSGPVYQFRVDDIFAGDLMASGAD